MRRSALFEVGTSECFLLLNLLNVAFLLSSWYVGQRLPSGHLATVDIKVVKKSGYNNRTVVLGCIVSDYSAIVSIVGLR